MTIRTDWCEMLSEPQIKLLSQMADGADENTVVVWAPMQDPKLLDKLRKIETLMNALLCLDEESLDKIMGLSERYFDDPNGREL